MLRVAVEKRLGDFRLDIALEAEPGTRLAVVGENGSGKTTLLRLIAGLDTPDRGAIEAGGETWFRKDTGISRPARDRAVGWVPQEDALFPHLDVLQNVAFGLRARHVAAKVAAARALAMLERLGAAEFAARRPAALSGGQRQRVALARALVTEPRVLLLDEPLSAIDVASRQALRAEIYALLQGLPCVTLYVTHTPLEALALGDRIAVLEGGRLVQIDPPAALLRHPRSPYVAAFLGMNLFRGRVKGREPSGLARIESEGGEIFAFAPEGATDVFVAVHPRDITLQLEPPATSARNVFRGAILEAAPEPPHGERHRIALATRPPLVAEVTRDAVEALGLRPGREVYASFKASGVVSYE